MGGGEPDAHASPHHWQVRDLRCVAWVAVICAQAGRSNSDATHCGGATFAEILQVLDSSRTHHVAS